MTDLERFMATYNACGIDLAVTTEDDKQVVYLEGGDGPEITKSNKLCAGYSGFCSTIWFTLEGKFIEQGFYE